ncbi:MAG: lipopolysaccharide biosynthesis protein [Bacteroidales bacterium]|nr:lipopolysaccharide biosynthesis protein [Bacteroidales bacterium]
MATSELKTKTARGLFWGAMNNGLQQVIGVVIGLFLLSLLAPDDYGIVAKLAIISGIASALQEGGFKAALVGRGKYDPQDYNSVFWFSVTVSATLYLILFFAAPLIADLFHQSELVKVSRWVFLSFFFTSLSIASDALLLRNMLTRQRAVAELAGAAISGVITVIAALKGLGFWALVLHSVLQSLIVSLIKIAVAPWKPSFSFSFKPVGEMFRFGFKLVIGGFIFQIQNNIFSTILGLRSTDTEVGYYSQGTKWAGMGQQVFSGMISNVGQPAFCNAAGDSSRQLAIFRKLCKFTAFMACPALLGLGLIAPEFIDIFNKRFNNSVPILQIYCIFFLISILHGLMSQLAIARGHSGRTLIANIIGAVLQIGTAIVSSRYGLVTMAVCATVANIVTFAVWFFMVRNMVELKIWHLAVDILPYLLIAAAVMVVAMLAASPFTADVPRLAVKIGTAAVLYLGIMKFVPGGIFNEAIKFIKDRQL